MLRAPREQYNTGVDATRQSSICMPEYTVWHSAAPEMNHSAFRCISDW
ncbi:hypothetical protein BPSOL_0852 [Bifidobacterium pseudolongum]|nr:hypothetical protein BPSOL_0852 [Bifidobacterium pseudolongum]